MDAIREKSAKMAKEMMDFVNCSHSRKEFAKEIVRGHRYLQGEFMELMMECMREYRKAFTDGNFDGRNQYAVKIADEILRELEN